MCSLQNVFCNNNTKKNLGLALWSMLLHNLYRMCSLTTTYKGISTPRSIVSFFIISLPL